MRSYTFRVFSVALLAVAPGLLQAQAKPNFSGTWKLNTGMRDFGAIPAPDSRTGTAKWEGDELAIDGKGSFNGADVTLNAPWSLSEDGKTLTIQWYVSGPMGETDERIVLEKQ